jgi:O-antigen/teichoic acid export membrane protein
MQKINEWFHLGHFSFPRSWGLRGGMAIADQGLFSGSNFIVNVLLARWLIPDDFGAFSLAYAVYIFMSGFHNAFVLEPVTILATSKYADRIESYLYSQIRIHFVITMVMSALVVCAGLGLRTYKADLSFFSTSLVGVGIFLPLMLWIWLARRTCYILGKPELAFVSSIIYSLILIGGAVIIHAVAVPRNGIFWYGLFGTASLIGSLVVYSRLKHLTTMAHEYKWPQILEEQLLFGRWIVVAALLSFAATQIQVFALAIYLGLAEAGQFRAIQNFILPMIQIVTAISTLSLPRIAQDYGRLRFGDMKKRSFRAAKILLWLSATYWILLIVFGSPLEKFLYAGKFAGFSLFISILGIIPVLSAIEMGYSMIVRSLQRPVYHAIWNGVMALVGLTLGIWMTRSWGLFGATLSLIAVSLASVVTNMYYYQKWYLPLLKKEIPQ